MANQFEHLSAGQRGYIRRLARNGMRSKAIAAMYGVKQDTVFRIIDDIIEEAARS